jgi:uncharacterized protein YjbI with pentapeptide repeats
MQKPYTTDQIFTNETELAMGEYDNCTFRHCTLANTNLSEYVFTDCVFEHCDLSMASLSNTSFREVKFVQCKLLGLHFDECNPFSLSFEFETCLLNLSSFYRLKIKNTRFIDCKMEEVALEESNLTNAVFKGCDLRGAIFDQTILVGADLRTAVSFSIDPERNSIQKAKFSMQNIAGLLDKYKISIS